MNSNLYATFLSTSFEETIKFSAVKNDTFNSRVEKITLKLTHVNWTISVGLESSGHLLQRTIRLARNCLRSIFHPHPTRHATILSMELDEWNTCRKKYTTFCINSSWVMIRKIHHAQLFPSSNSLRYYPRNILSPAGLFVSHFKLSRYIDMDVSRKSLPGISHIQSIICWKSFFLLKENGKSLNITIRFFCTQYSINVSVVTKL